MKQAQAAFDKKDYAEAITQADVALENKTKDPAATKLKTDAQQQLTKEQKYQTAMKQGQAAFDKKDYAEAITHAGVALETNPRDLAASKLKRAAEEEQAYLIGE